jgi:hypothetical protein
MPSITMWRVGARRCILRVESGRFDLHMLNGDDVVQQQRAKTADNAVLLAEIWRETYGEAPTVATP